MTERTAVRVTEAASEAVRPTMVSRTGVPFLMDLPLIGVLCRRTSVSGGGRR